MLLNNQVFIRCIWVFAAAAVLFYCLPMLFTHCEQPALANGATVYDVIYYTCDKLFRFFLSMLFSTMCLVLESNFKQEPSLSYLKYLSYCISAILFVRMSFHFHYYERVPNIELCVYVLCVVGITIRAFCTIHHLKHLSLSWGSKLRYHLHTLLVYAGVL